MSALSWSIALTALFYGASLCAEEHSGPGEKIVVVEDGGGLAVPGSSAPSKEKPGDARVRQVGAGRFEIEFGSESNAQAKGNKTEPAPIQAAEEQKEIIVLPGARYWVGLTATPLIAAQRKELNVQGELGLLIEQISPDSPAAKAGLKPKDVLVKVGDKPLHQLSDLVSAIQESKGQDLQLELKRDDKLLKITVSPAKRPDRGIENRLVEPEIRLDPPGAAQSQNADGETALRQAQERLAAALAQARQTEAQGPADAAIRERVKSLLAERRELQERVHDLNEKLESLARNPGDGSVDKIRGQMHEAEERIEAINRQAVALEINSGNPDQQKLARQLLSLRQCATELDEVGRTEDAKRLKSAAHEVEERLAAINEARDRSRSMGIQYIPGPGMPGAPLARGGFLGAVAPGANPWGLATIPQPDPEAMRQSQIKTAIQLLGQAGLREDAERLQQKLSALEREQKERREPLTYRLGTPEPNLAIAELRDQVQQMHHQLKELQEAVARLSKAKE